uniref:Leucine rich repeat containing 29 n=1 Tax=Petromyzon marinus TaxID=7757 RepID=S4RA60_PETMA
CVVCALYPVRPMSIPVCISRATVVSCVHLTCHRVSRTQASSVVSLAVALGASLRELDLSSCVAVTDASVRAISTSLATLRVLRLAWCRELTDWGLLGIERPCLQPLLPSSHTVALSHCGLGLAPPSPAEVEAGEVGPRLSALTQLAELDLANCFRVTDASLTQVLRFPELRCLHVSHLCELSDAALLALSRGCPSLERLSLAGCYRLSDGGLAAAAPLLRRLRHLDLSRCEQVSDSVLDALAGSCPWLRSLDVSRCSRITLEAVERLQAALPELGDVHMRSANGQDLAYAL